LAADAKTILKRAVKRAFRVVGRGFRRSGSRILTYHSVGFRGHDMNVRPRDFRLQMDWLAGHAPILTLAQAAEGREGVAITFDDGFRDNAVIALPILHSLDIPATVFVVAGRVGGFLDDEADPQTGRLLTWEEIEESVKAGFDIGSHTLTHPRLARLSEADQRKQIRTSKRLLEDRLGISIDAFAYPYGSRADFNRTSIHIVQQCGYRYGLSNCYGTNGTAANPWALKRIWIDATDDLETFQAKVDGRLDLLAVLDSPAGLQARRILNWFTR
jgi:peptidoglycan/xylan/chitin deacetylase (PgdA/CDA1 family)